MENSKKGTWVASILVIVAIVALVVFFGKKTETLPENYTTTEVSSSIVYAQYSNGTTTVNATFNNDSSDFKNSTVTFEHPLVGEVTLPVAISGSGARYANEDESIEFWEHQGELTITKDGENIFVGKLVETTGQ